MKPKEQNIFSDVPPMKRKRRTHRKHIARRDDMVKKYRDFLVAVWANARLDDPEPVGNIAARHHVARCTNAQLPDMAALDIRDITYDLADAYIDDCRDHRQAVNEARTAEATATGRTAEAIPYKDKKQPNSFIY